jgi:hypothetical protein
MNDAPESIWKGAAMDRWEYISNIPWKDFRKSSA